MHTPLKIAAALAVLGLGIWAGQYFSGLVVPEPENSGHESHHHAHHERTELNAVTQFQRPYYSSQLVSCVIQQELYKASDPKRWREICDSLVAQHGPQYRQGLFRELLEETTAGRGDRAQPILKAIQIVAPDPHRIEFPIEQADLAKLIDKSPPDAAIDAEAKKIFAKLDPRVYDVYSPIDRALMNDDDRLAVACMRRLLGKGADADIRRYAESRADKSPEWGEEMKGILAKLK